MITTYCGYFSYQYRISERWKTNIVLGNNGILNPVFQPENAFQSAAYGAINAFYNLLPNLELAGEITIGQRVNKNGQSGSAERLQFYDRIP